MEAIEKVLLGTSVMLENLPGKRISLPNQFTGVVTVESVEDIDGTILMRVQTPEGETRDAILDRSQVEELLSQQEAIAGQSVRGEEPEVKRQRELDIRHDYDYLHKATNETIKAAGRSQRSRAAKVAKGNESFRMAREKVQNRVRSLQV